MIAHDLKLSQYPYRNITSYQLISVAYFQAFCISLTCTSPCDYRHCPCKRSWVPTPITYDQHPISPDLARYLMISHDLTQYLFSRYWLLHFSHLHFPLRPPPLSMQEVVAPNTVASYEGGGPRGCFKTFNSTIHLDPML